MKGKTEGVQKVWNKYKYVALVAVVGIVLLLWSSGTENAQAESRRNSASQWDSREVQTEMEEILTNISGVGQVKVMLTVDSDGERQLAQDSQLQYSGQTSAPEDYSRRSETVVVDDGSGDTPYIVKTVYPTYRGALVVCQGGDRPDVVLAVTEAVAALTGLSSDRITVAKWQ